MLLRHQNFIYRNKKRYAVLIGSNDAGTDVSYAHFLEVQMVLRQKFAIFLFSLFTLLSFLFSFLVWDQKKASRLNWLWFDVTTFENYTEESSFENSLLVQQSGSLALSSLKHVLRSLTPNARGIFMLLVNHQLDNESNSTHIGKILY